MQNFIEKDIDKVKNIKAALLLLLAALLLSACQTKQPGYTVSSSGELPSEEELKSSQFSGTSSSDDDDFVPSTAEPFDYMANDLTAYVKLGEYIGVPVTRESDVLTDEEFEDEIDYLLQSYATYETITDRPVEEGETILADFAGYLDGVAFEGGTGTEQTIVASGDSGYIAGFAEAFIGQTPGVEFDFDVTFPEDYFNADLAGREVTFVCTIHYIQGSKEIVPELTDEFVRETFSYNNVEEFRILYRDTVEAQKAYYVESTMYSDLWTTVVANAEILAYPTEEVDRVYSERRVMYEDYAEYYGMGYAEFLSSYAGMTDDELYTECQSYVKEDLVMYQLIKELGVEPTEEEYAEGIEFFANYYGTTSDELISYYGEDTIRSTILWQALMEKIAETAVITVGAA